MECNTRQWLNRRGESDLPALSTELTSLNHLWGYVESVVYKDKCRGARITAEIHRNPSDTPHEVID